MSDEEREFAAAPTVKCLYVFKSETPPGPEVDQHADTAVRQLCWKHGAIVFNADAGTDVRLPVQDCAECAKGAA
jgi:hypothetical protein